jgi:6-phosphogluconolactonase
MDGGVREENRVEPELVIMENPQALAQEAARRFVEHGDRAIADHGVFLVALSGGSTPKAMYEALAEEPYRSAMNWDRTQAFFSDERFVPPDSDESNYHTAHVAMLSKVPIPERNIHKVATVDIGPEESAANYEEGIRRVFHVAESDVPRFDLVLLGIGPDGHTASLFPGTQALTENTRLVVPNYVPKFDSWRITFTYRLINAAGAVAFLSQGPDKAERLRQVYDRQADLPAAGVHPSDGTLSFWIDRGAAAQLQTGDAAP